MFIPGKRNASSIRILSQQLIKRGFTIRELPLNTSYVEFSAPNGWKWITSANVLAYPFTAISTVQISRDKVLSYAFARFHGVSIPRTLEYPAEESKLNTFLNVHTPLIVKPKTSYGSHGLTFDVTTKEALLAAIITAQQYCPEVLVQQQFKGDEVRFTVVKGEVVSCIERQTPRVIGDGASTIKELIRKENAERAALKFDMVPYPQLDASFIPPSFFTDESIPATGKVIELTKSTLVDSGGSMRDVTDAVHETYKATAVKLSDALNCEFIVIDMLISNYTKPQTDSNYVFLEFTTAPSLRLYYNVRSGHEYDIADKLAELIEERSKR